MKGRQYNTHTLGTDVNIQYTDVNRCRKSMKGRQYNTQITRN